MSDFERALSVIKIELVEGITKALYSASNNVKNYSLESKSNCCSIDGCAGDVVSHELCNAHYLRKRKNKDMVIPVRNRKNDLLCMDCGSEVGVKGGLNRCPRHYKKKRRDIIKEAIVNILGGKCSACGVVYPMCVYDFHHLDQKPKDPSHIITNNSISKISEELSKCVLLCSNCHRIEHYNERL